MKVYIVGTGMEGKNTLTNEGKRAIEESSLLIGAGRMTEPFRSMGKLIYESYIPEEIIKILDDSHADTASVLMSGDCGFFSGAKRLSEMIEGHDTEIISGISSPVYLCGKLGISYENMKYISLHGTDSNIAINVSAHEKCFFLLGGDKGVRDVCRILTEYSLSHTEIFAGENLGYEKERIISGKPRELMDVSFGKLSSLIAVNRDHLKHIPTGIDDELFCRDAIPMTKSVVRGCIISKLCIGKSDICWDIGCGSGSVSVEMAYRCMDGRVYSFDKNIKAVELTEKNARKFSCDNIIAIHGECPEITEDIPAPHKVFIGGSTGRLPEILSVIYGKNPHADIVITAVSLETPQLALKAFEEYGTVPEIIQLSVANTKRTGRHTMMQAQNPVFIIKGKLK